MRVHNNLMSLIGNTPLLELTNYNKNRNLRAKIVAKLESFNPTASVKDRPAYAMILDAEVKGRLKKNSVIIEPTSGNTGIGLAMISAIKGYRLILTMPETMSIERRKLLELYGAELVLTDGSKGMKGAIEKAEELADSIKDSFIPSQFSNPANIEIHFKTTGPEIFNDMDGLVDIFVSGVGTGGTITGAGEYLRSVKKDIEIVAVEPESSAVLSGENPGKHKIQGIGAGFIPKVLNTNIYDQVIKISDEQALKTMKDIAREDGLLVGISSGAALAAATKLAKLSENMGKNIVVVFPDTGHRYLSSL